MGVFQQYDLTEQASIYGSYHNNVWNRLIHAICVPMIMFGLYMWLDFVELPFFLPIPQPISQLLPPAAMKGTIAHVLITFACLYYGTLDPVVSLFLFISSILMSMWGNVIVTQYGVSYAISLGIIIQVFGWGVQVGVGHGYFEGRKPALLDSLFQVIVSPFFLALEGLFLFGYRSSLQQEIDKRVAQKIAEWKRADKREN